MPKFTKFETPDQKEKRLQQREYNRRYYRKKKGQLVKDAEKKIACNSQQPVYLVSIMQRLTNEGIAKGNYPWKTFGETIRGVLVFGLKYMKENSDEMIADEWASIETNEHLHRLGTQRRQAEVVVNRVTEEIAKLQSIDNDRAAIQAYNVVRDNIHKMPPTVWRDWAIDKMKANFPELEKIVLAGKVPGMKMFSKHQLKPRGGERRDKKDRRKRRK